MFSVLQILLGLDEAKTNRYLRALTGDDTPLVFGAGGNAKGFRDHTDREIYRYVKICDVRILVQWTSSIGYARNCLLAWFTQHMYT